MSNPNVSSFPAVLQLVLIHGQLVVSHRADRQYPSITLIIPRNELGKLEPVGVRWQTLELDARTIQECLASPQGVSKKHRQVRGTPIHVDMTLLANSKDQMVTIVIVVDNRQARTNWTYKAAFPAEALLMAVQARQKFYYAMRVLQIMDDPHEDNNPLVNAMLEVIDETDKQLHKQAQERARLTATVEEQKEHKEGDQQKPSDGPPQAPTEAPVAPTPTTQVATSGAEAPKPTAEAPKPTAEAPKPTPQQVESQQTKKRGGQKARPKQGSLTALISQKKGPQAGTSNQVGEKPGTPQGENRVLTEKPPVLKHTALAGQLAALKLPAPTVEAATPPEPPADPNGQGS